jgi:hypothetical protein
MPVLGSPVLVLAERDCRWLRPVLADLVERGFFDTVAPPIR